MTKLELMNLLLTSSGQLPVQDYNSNHPDAITARTYIDRWNQQSQHHGWYFNTMFNMTLTPESSNSHIVLPTGTFRVDVLSDTMQGTPRGGKLWNNQTNTFVWDTSLTADVFVVLDFDECPAVAQQYIAYSCLSEWHAHNEGDTLKIQAADRIAAGSRVSLNREHTRAINANVLKRPMAGQYLARQQRPSYGFNPVFPGGK